MIEQEYALAADPQNAKLTHNVVSMPGSVFKKVLSLFNTAGKLALYALEDLTLEAEERVRIATKRNGSVEIVAQESVKIITQGTTAQSKADIVLDATGAVRANQVKFVDGTLRLKGHDVQPPGITAGTLWFNKTTKRLMFFNGTTSVVV